MDLTLQHDVSEQYTIRWHRCRCCRVGGQFPVATDLAGGKVAKAATDVVVVVVVGSTKTALPSFNDINIDKV